MKKGNYFRKKFDIHKDIKIIIYAGHIADWSLCKEIVQGSLSWPNRYALVIHSWQIGIQNDNYTIEIKKIAGQNVYFSFEPIEREIFPEALSSCDAGLMFYKPINESYIEIGSSSNKLAQYLRVGLPVIASDFPSIRDIFTTYNCGICIPSPFEIGITLDKLFDRYETFRQGAYNAYENHYNFDLKFKPIFEEMKNLIASYDQRNIS